MPETIVIKADRVGLTHSDGSYFGPLDFSLTLGQGLLIELPYLDLMRRMMRCCQGRERPQAGTFSWDLGVYPDKDSRWARYDFLRRIGFVDRDCQLLNSLTLRKNLELYFSYARREDVTTLAAQAMEKFEVDLLADIRIDDLAEPHRRLALYTLALAKEPFLMLIERPVQFLDRDFNRIWGWIKEEAARERMAYMVFDRNSGLYDKGDFKAVVRLEAVAQPWEE